MAAELNLEQKLHDTSQKVRDHAEHVFSRHSDRVERRLEEQISALQSQLDSHEHARRTSHLRFYLTIAGVIAASALIHFRRHKAR
ncbi:hypothetical protein AA0472_1729 [Acetobacter estunensis NRIC 0472]|uniref:Uncharacterized protein n=1 Tax=Acetobacter estunensis TaxID=104097 RepID=A0A967EEE0_9PROT|nr:hypothetical protein [Acetobacter estunensis]NHO54955.1 hypothetical protein [Acetobacter estunensis]GBQ25354.1 hypothetical protein AA0472_1729 [Acetobacter estunensis NRIC 0472]